jgi:hypothetical protein
LKKKLLAGFSLWESVVGVAAEHFRRIGESHLRADVNNLRRRRKQEKRQSMVNPDR